jgi:hypothetical protein
MKDNPSKPNTDNKPELDFEFEELEARIAPSVVASCSGCSGCSQPGCASCGLVESI